MVLCPIVGIVQFFSGLQEIWNCSWNYLSLNQYNCMSMTLVCFVLIFQLMTSSAMELSVWSRVGGCVWPSSSSMIRIYTVSRTIIHKPFNSASVSDVMTCVMMCAMLRMAPLLAGIVVLLERKKCLPARLWALESLRYLLSLCTDIIMFLALYVSTASSYVAK